jgi:hypothetical protein
MINKQEMPRHLLLPLESGPVDAQETLLLFSKLKAT